MRIACSGARLLKADSLIVAVGRARGLDVLERGRDLRVGELAVERHKDRRADAGRKLVRERDEGPFAARRVGELPHTRDARLHVEQRQRAEQQRAAGDDERDQRAAHHRPCGARPEAVGVAVRRGAPRRQWHPHPVHAIAQQAQDDGQQRERRDHRRDDHEGRAGSENRADVDRPSRRAGGGGKSEALRACSVYRSNPSR
jgi:hypothetical protein